MFYADTQQYQMSDTIKKSLRNIFDIFKDSNDKIDLFRVQNYFQQNRNLKESCRVFINKLEKYLKDKRDKKTAYLKLDEFLKQFDPDFFDANHFQAVFRAIDSDGSGMITKKELKILLEKYKVQANTEEINMMIEVCSQDGQKVKIKDLEDFLQSDKSFKPDKSN